MAPHLKTAEEIAVMREAGRIVARAHQAMRQAVCPGVTTLELDKIAEKILRDSGAIPAFLGYPKPDSPNFPASICASVNNELVHGIPGPRVLKEGDIISIDIGSIYKGFVGDSAWTYAVGQIKPSVQRLLDVTEEALFIGIRTSVLGTKPVMWRRRFRILSNARDIVSCANIPVMGSDDRCMKNRKYRTGGRINAVSAAG